MDKADFTAQAMRALETPSSLIYAVLLKHKTSELEEWYEQIQQRDQQIQQLKDLLARAAVYVTAEALPNFELPRDRGFARALLNDIDKVLNEE